MKGLGQSIPFTRLMLWMVTIYVPLDKVKSTKNDQFVYLYRGKHTCPCFVPSYNYKKKTLFGSIQIYYNTQ